MQYHRPVPLHGQQLKMNRQLFQSMQLMALPDRELTFRIEEELPANRQSRRLIRSRG